MQAKKGLPNAVPNSANQSRENERKNKKHEKHEKHKLLRIKNGSCVDNNTIRHNNSQPSPLTNQQDKVYSFSPSSIVMHCVSPCLTLRRDRH